MELIYLLFSCPQLCAHNCVWHLNCVRQCALTIATQDNPADLWQLRHWLQFLQLRIWIHDNLCYLTIKSDTGQHSQFLRCFTHGVMNVRCIFPDFQNNFSDFQNIFPDFQSIFSELWIFFRVLPEKGLDPGSYDPDFFRLCRRVASSHLFHLSHHISFTFLTTFLSPPAFNVTPPILFVLVYHGNQNHGFVQERDRKRVKEWTTRE